MDLNGDAGRGTYEMTDDIEDTRQSELSFHVRIWESVKDRNGKDRVVSTAELARMLMTHEIRADHEKDGPLWSPTLYKKGTTRGNANVISISCLVFDIDNGSGMSGIEKRWQDYGYITHTTWGHTPESPRKRVVFPLATPVSAEMWPEYWERANVYLCSGKSDPSAKDIARIYYTPSCPVSNRSYAESSAHDGPLLDMSKLPQVRRLPITTTAITPPNGEQVSADDGFYSLLIEKALDKVSRGDGRNNTGLWLACQMRDAGFTQDECLNCDYPDLVPSTNTKGEQEPFTRQIWKSVVRNAYSRPKRSPWEGADGRFLSEGDDLYYDEVIPDDTEIGFETPPEPEKIDTLYELAQEALHCGIHPCTDLGNAERLCERYGSIMRYVRTWGSWVVWDGKVWKKDALELANRLAHNVVRSIIDEIKDAPEQMKEPLIKWAHKSEDNGKIKAMLEMASHIEGMSASHEAFDQHPYLLSCRNGVIDLTNGELKPHDPEMLITRSVDTDYIPDAKCPRYRDAVRLWMDNDPEMEQFLIRAQGYSLLGANPEQCLFFLEGDGANGKTVAMETMRIILGSQFVTRVPAETFMIKGDQHPTARADIEGARVVMSSEIDVSGRLNEALIKDITGNEVMSARRMHCNFFQFKPVAKLWMHGNHRPTIHGSDNGIWRRILLIPFTVTIPENERDPFILEKLEKEKEGIFALMVKAAIECYKSGLRPPEKVIKVTSGYRNDQDIIGEWFDDNCISGENYTVQRQELYSNYRVWAESRGLRVLSAKWLANELQRRYKISSHKSSGVRYWVGISIVQRPND